MNGHDFGKKIILYLYEELSDKESIKLKRHLKGCPNCRLELERLRETIETFQQVEMLEPPHSCGEAVRRLAREKLTLRDSWLNRAMNFPKKFVLRMPRPVIAGLSLIIRLLSLSSMVWGRGNNTGEAKFAIIPWPVEVTQGSGELVLDQNSKIMASRAAREVAEMLADDLRERFDLNIPVSLIKDEKIVPMWAFVLIIPGSGTMGLSPLSAEIPVPPEFKESYLIKITPDALVLSGNDRTGLYWGTRTILQLLVTGNENYAFPAVEIQDWPRFYHRSLLLDPARNFISPSYLKRTIDLMADHKYNVLHLHLTDDQGWRFESRIFPRLQEIGGEGVYYTQDELRELVAYAAERGITVLPEIDMPGHVAAMLAAYPELSCTGKPAQVVRHSAGIYPYALCPAKEGVYDFIDKLLAEVVAVFPYEYIHIGSDEVTAYDWKRCPACKKLISEKNLTGKDALHTYFLERVNEIILRHGRRMMAWDEVIEFAPEGIIVQAWKSQKRAKISAEYGQLTLCSPIQTTYLNNSRIILPLRKCYRFDPVPPGLGPQEKKLIIGGGANLWGDYLKSENDIDRHLFPRLLALAEVYWSPKEARNYSDFLVRLAPVRKKLEDRGVEFGDVGFTTVKDTFRMAWIFINVGRRYAADWVRQLLK